MNQWLTACGNATCIEVRSTIGQTHVLIRSTERREESIVCSADEWREFVAGVKAGKFDEVAP